MTDEEKRAMNQFGITSEEKTIFHFQGHKYERLSDALEYAKKTGSNKKPLENGSKK